MSPQHSRLEPKVATRRGRSVDVRVRHQLPGRMRLQVLVQRKGRFHPSGFVVHSDEASSIVADLSRRDGIVSVRWNDRSGNFLIQYSPQIPPSRIILWLESVVSQLPSIGTHAVAPQRRGERPAVQQDAAWAGWCLLLGAGVGLARLIGFRFAAAHWLSMASWLLTLMQGYNISPERDASAEGDEGIPALSTGLHVLQGNPIQLSSIYTSRIHRYMANHHLKAMPLGHHHRGYPPLPKRIRTTVARQGRVGWQGAALTWLLTRNPWLGFAALLAGNPRPARVGGLAVQSRALRMLDEAGIRLADWPEWERLTTLDGVVIDAALFPSVWDAEMIADGAGVVDTECSAFIVTLRGLGVGNIIIAGLGSTKQPVTDLERIVQATGADLATAAPPQDVHERLGQRHAVGLVTVDSAADEVLKRTPGLERDAVPEQSVAWRWIGPDGTAIQLGSSGPRALVLLLHMARRVEAASERVATATTLTGLVITSLASTGRMAPGMVAVAVESAALLAALVGATVEPTPIGSRTRRQRDAEVEKRWQEIRANLPEALHTYDGLSSFEASLRRAEVGPNQTLVVQPLTPLGAVARQFSGPFVLILALGAGVSALVGQRSDAIAMGILLGVNAILGAAQELRAGQSTHTNKHQDHPNVSVRRDGEWTNVPDTMLVPGDLIRLEGGDVVPADAWVLVDRGALLDESNLTGESEGIPKTPLETLQKNGSLPMPWGRRDELGGERGLQHQHAGSTIWAGTHLIRGRIVALVIATGRHTRVSRLASAMNRQRLQAGPLQRELGHWFQKALMLSAVVGLGVALLGTLRGHPKGQMISTGVSMALAAIPEGLPAILTLSFATCAGRLRPGRVAVKRLGALEALGCVSVLCLDKTGTLTQNDMRVERILLPGGRVVDVESLTSRSVSSRVGWARELRWAILVGAGCNEVQKGSDGQWTGDPMELALVRLADQVGFDHENWHSHYPRVTERPFDAVAGYMAVLCGDDKEAWVLVKGAPERVIPQCTSILIGGKPRSLTEDDRKALLERGMTEADLGRRLLSLAYRPARTDDKPDGLAQGLIYAGTVSFSDPLRPETAEALRSFQDADVRTVMITGDHVRTAEAIARQLNIGGESPSVMTGPEVAELSRRELAERVAEVDVFARVTPHEKMRIVEALQRKGEVVAVTGDGVNDTPALRQADVGIALAAGTPAAIEAADVLLMEDTLSGIIRCVKEGSRLRKRLRSATGFLASGNMGEILFMTGAMVLGMPPPLLPSQILLMNVFTDALPALGLALSNDGDTEAPAAAGNPHPNRFVLPLERPSQLADEAMRRRIVANGIRTAASGLLSFGFALRRGDVSQARTAGFISAAITQLLQAGKYCQETSQQPSGRRAGGENNWFPSSMLGAWGMLLAGLTIPSIRKWFHLTPITQGFSVWGIIPPLVLRIVSEGPAKLQSPSAGRNT